MKGSKIPHPLRIIIFFLRLALGVNFLYIGIAALFDANVMKNLHGQSFTGLYAWLSNGTVASPAHVFFAWASLIIGGCLVLGLATRLASALGIILVTLSYSPTIFPATTIYTLANIDAIIILCLLVLLFSNAGTYLGLDTFIHVRLPGKQKK